MKKYTKIGKLFLSLCILACTAMPVWAANDDFTADGDITVSAVTFGGSTADLLILNGSQAESWSVSGGAFSVTNTGNTFMVGSSDGTVTAFKASAGGQDLACALNTSAGTSYLDLPLMASTYTITPLAITNCDELCAVLTGAATYNAFPTCGAASCNSGYTLSGSGSGATCAAVSSGGGGGGSVPVASTNASTVDQVPPSETYATAADGTVLNAKTTFETAGGAAISATVDATIVAGETPAETQTVTLDASKTSEVKTLDLRLPPALIAELAPAAGGKIEILAVSREASAEQKTHDARGGQFLVGFDVFEVKIKANGEPVSDFQTPLTLSFDLSASKYKDKDLKLHYFNGSLGRWVLAGDGGTRSGDRLVAALPHLTIFALIFQIITPSAEAAVMDDRTWQMQRVYSEAAVVHKSGENLDAITGHNRVSRNAKAQSDAMAKYTEPMLTDISGLTRAQTYAINNFIVYGTETTRVLGAGERAGVVNSYKKAFLKVPRSEEEWKDAIAIANGRWPGEKAAAAEEQAKAKFKEVYRRDANMAQANDNAAVTVMAYGLRSAKRNTGSEGAAARIFSGIFKYVPKSALDWDIVRAIAYSGAKR